MRPAPPVHPLTPEGLAVLQHFQSDEHVVVCSPCVYSAVRVALAHVEAPRVQIHDDLPSRCVLVLPALDFPDALQVALARLNERTP